MAEHLEHHVTSQTRKDYLSFRGKNKICLLPKYPRVSDLEKHFACLDVILTDWQHSIMPFLKEIEDMKGHINFLLSYDEQHGDKIRSLMDQLQPHLRRLDESKSTGEYKIWCFTSFFHHFPFSNFSSIFISLYFFRSV